MRGHSKAIRAISVGAFAIAPLAAVGTSGAAVQTGDAVATGPGIAFENTGGNVELGTGHSESRVVIGNPAESAPAVAAPTGLSTLAKPAAKPVNPSGAAVARANALVAAARARAQAQIAAARLKAAQAVEQAKQQAEDARSRSQAQSDAARAQSQQQSSSWSSDADAD